MTLPMASIDASSERIRHSHDDLAGAGIGELAEATDVVGDRAGVRFGREAGGSASGRAMPVEQVRDVICRRSRRARSKMRERHEARLASLGLTVCPQHVRFVPHRGCVAEHVGCIRVAGGEAERPTLPPPPRTIGTCSCKGRG